MRAEDILYFWFTECSQSDWWQKSAIFDAVLKRRFSAVHVAAKLGELASWRSTGRGRLAEIIVLDQFSRNIYRDDPKAFATDAMRLYWRRKP